MWLELCRSFPVKKVTSRLFCSLASALTALRLATNFFRGMGVQFPLPKLQKYFFSCCLDNATLAPQFLGSTLFFVFAAKLNFVIFCCIVTRRSKVRFAPFFFDRKTSAATTPLSQKVTLSRNKLRFLRFLK